MALSRPRSLIAAGALVVSVFVPGALAQPQQTGQRMPMYDTRTESTFTGTVEAVDVVTPAGRSGRRSLGGTHLSLKTATETLEVHLGPTAFLTEKKVDITKGDTLEITGSRVTIGDEQVLLAREIKKGDSTWTLRDASGRPLWSASRR